MFTRDSISGYLTNLAAAVSYPFETWRGTIGLVLVTVATYVLLILSTMPEFSLRCSATASTGSSTSSSRSRRRSTGPTAGRGSRSSSSLRPAFRCVAVVNAVAQLRIVGLSSLTDLSGIVPDSSRRAVRAAVPASSAFSGSLVGWQCSRTTARCFASAGSPLLVFFLGRAGHPEHCAITTEATK